MTDYAEISRTLEESLKLAMPPIAVCFTDEPPAGVPRPDRARPAGCVFWEEAAAGPVVTTAMEHELCSIGIYTHNLTGATASYQSELGDVLKVMADMSYVRPEDVGQIPVLARQTRFVTYAPLAVSPLAPDVVLLFAHSRQSLVITEAVQQVEGGTPPAMGRPACAVVPQASNTGRAAMSLGCCGARAYLKALSDDVALWALPGSGIERYAARVADLAKANETLTKFHIQRQKDVEAGMAPTYRESLGRF